MMMSLSPCFSSLKVVFDSIHLLVLVFEIKTLNENISEDVCHRRKRKRKQMFENIKIHLTHNIFFFAFFALRFVSNINQNWKLTLTSLTQDSSCFIK